MSAPRASGSFRRSLIPGGIGLVLAAGLAIVLLSGSRPSDVQSDVAPGIDAASAKLLALDVISPNQSPLAPAFRLTNQNGHPTSLAQFRGKVVVWSLNDDQCTDLCALFAQDVLAADKDLGKASKDVTFLSVNANPFYPSPDAVKAWSVRNDLESLPNWVYVTGTPAELEETWNKYDVTVLLDRRNRTVAHDAIVEFIDPTGHLRAIGYFDQGSISTAYYAHAMAQMADDLLPKSEQTTVGGLDVEARSTEGATIGDAAPSFSLQDLSTGDLVRLNSFERQPVVLNFWSSNCEICTQEMPALQQVADDFKGRMNFVGVDVADPEGQARTFARKFGVTYPLVADPDGTTAAAYRVDALPVTFILSPGGTIVARHEGALTHDELVAILQMDFSDDG